PLQAAVAADGRPHAGDAAPPALVAPVAPEGAVRGAVGGALDLPRAEAVGGAATGLGLGAARGGQRTGGVGDPPPQIPEDGDRVDVDTPGACDLLHQVQPAIEAAAGEPGEDALLGALLTEPCGGVARCEAE